MLGCKKSTRMAFSLLELIIVIAIFAVIVALLLPAISKVRETARLAQSKNNLKQITLASHSYLETNNGAFQRERTPNQSASVFSALAPYLELDTQVVSQGNSNGSDRENQARVFMSPGDPTLNWTGSAGLFTPDGKASRPSNLTSYVYNYFLFAGSDGVSKYKNVNQLLDVTDGLSNTVFFCEHYSRCDSYTFVWFPAPNGMVIVMPSSTLPHYDLVTTGNPHVTDIIKIPYYENKATFQTRPCSKLRMYPNFPNVHPNPDCGSTPICDPSLPQTPFSAGLPVAMGDGSVRVVSPTIDSKIFWGAFTPNRGEVLGDW